MILLLQLLVHVLGVHGFDAMSGNNDIKPGHQIVKEYHFHPYWHQNNHQEVTFTVITILSFNVYIVLICRKQQLLLFVMR